MAFRDSPRRGAPSTRGIDTGSPAQPGLFDAPARPTSTQSAPASAEPLSVSDVNQRARTLLERQLGRVTVAGEVSTAKLVNGHWYLGLKDARSQLPAVMFRREAVLSRVRPEPGAAVWATGRLTVYAPQGKYQLVIERLELQGQGDLHAALEALKHKLAEEGLFAQERKRALPQVPRRVAVITSPTGAVIRDIVHVAQRRFPRCQIVVLPSRVQGAEAVPTILAALARLSEHHAALGVDVAIVARGGGSLEDLWAYNDERVARAIAACPVPIVSAVGHETDVTIADFVADVRAPTPSAAAEVVFPVTSELEARLRGCVTRQARCLRRSFELSRHRLRDPMRRLGDGTALVHERAQTLDVLRERAHRACVRALAAYRERLRAHERSLATSHPRARLERYRGRLSKAEGRLVLLARQRLRSERQSLTARARALHALSPLAVLDRGYSVTFDAEGAAVRDAATLKVGDPIAVRVARGRLWAKVERVQDDGSDDER